MTSESTVSPPPDQPVGSTTSSDADNGIVRVRERAALRPRAFDDRIVPEAVSKLFSSRQGDYYFPDGALAFTDRGRELTTPSENREVIRSLVAIASARGWAAVEVRGSERFRRDAWAVAAGQGLQVLGYEPPTSDRPDSIESSPEKVAAGAPTPNESESGPVISSKSRAARHAPIAGQLLAHGAAPYLQQGGNHLSYFVAVETGKGPRTVWGVDLARALRESETQPQLGDRIELRSVRRDLVTVKAAGQDVSGSEATESKTAFRNRWVVEKEGFFVTRKEAADVLRKPSGLPQQAVGEHPNLTSSYVFLKVADELASRQFLNRLDRERFVAGVRSVLADTIEQGEPWVRARIREHSRPPPPEERTTERSR